MNQEKQEWVGLATHSQNVGIRMKRSHKLLLTSVFSLALAASSRADLYSNGFETDIVDWDAFGGPFNATRVASGTNGITSASGGFHAESSAAGSASRWGGYNFGAGNAVATAFQEYKTSVDIFLNVGGLANGSRFDFDSAINNSAGTFLRDFVFNAGYYDSTDVTGPGAGTNRFVISASNNSQPGSAYAKNPARSPIAIDSAGWYTFENHFYNDGGFLAVDMSILDSGDTVVGSWTVNTTDLIGSVGGNRYGWFDFNELPVLAFDNASLTVVPEPATALFGLLLMGVAVKGRKRGRSVPDLSPAR
jgi:hypothetical protein